MNYKREPALLKEGDGIIKKYIYFISIVVFCNMCGIYFYNPDSAKTIVTFLNNSSYSNKLNKTQIVDSKLIEMNEGFKGWDNCVWQNGQSIYYLNEHGIMEWNHQIDSNLILEESGIGGIVVDDSWLYYFKSNQKKIKRIKLNGDYHPEVVFDAEMLDAPETIEQISGFTLYNKKLYIKDTQISCYLYDSETGQLKLLNDDMACGVFFDNKLYYIEHSQRSFSIYATDLITSYTELIRGDGKTFHPEEPKRDLLYDKLIVVKGKLFYSTRVNPAIYLYADNGEDLLIEAFNSDEVFDAMFVQITTDGEYLYYNHENTNILHRFDPVKSRLTLITLPDDFKQTDNYLVVNNIVYYKLNNGICKNFVID